MLNKKLKHVRTSHKMTQETLALKLGVTRQTISKWENGISVPDADALTKIADIFEVPVSELLGTSEPSDENEKKDSDDMNENKKTDDRQIAETLSILNEQLAIKNDHRKTMIRIVKIVLIILGITMILPVFCMLAYLAFLTLIGC